MDVAWWGPRAHMERAGRSWMVFVGRRQGQLTMLLEDTEMGRYK